MNKTQHTEYNSDDELEDIGNNIAKDTMADTTAVATKKQKIKKTTIPSTSDLLIKKKVLDSQRRVILHKEKANEARMAAIRAALHRNDAARLQIEMHLEP